MAKQEIISYLREGTENGISLDFLKQKLIEGGYSKKEVNEAAEIVKNETGMEEAEEVSYRNRPGAKWMKVAGILGIIYLIISILLTLINFIPSFKGYMILLLANKFFLAFFSLIFISSFFYYPGFIRLGRRAGSKLISFYGWSMIAFILIFTLFYLLSFVFINFSNPASLIQNGSTTPIISSSSPLLGWSLLIIFILLIIFYLVVQVLFSAGLIKISRKVKFAKAAGIFNLLEIIISIAIVLAALGIAIFNPLYIAQIGFQFMLGTIPPSLIILIALAIIIFLLKLSALLFSSLALFDASKKFE